MREPTVFLFDQPLSDLDAKLRNQMRVGIKRLQRLLKVTTLHVIHDQIEAMTLADVMVVMKHSLIARQGTPLDMFECPSNMFVAGFVSSPQMNVFAGLANHAGLSTNPFFADALWSTMIRVVASIVFPLALGLALGLFFRAMPGQEVFKGIIFLPRILPPPP